MISMRTDRLLTPGEVCKLTTCHPSTLAQWRNRLGFLPREGDGHRRYTFGDLVAVRAMQLLTKRGIAASDALRIVAAISEEVDLERPGCAKVAIGRDASGELTAQSFSWGENAVFDFADEVLIVLSIGQIAWGLYFALCRLRGIAPKIKMNEVAA